MPRTSPGGQRKETLQLRVALEPITGKGGGTWYPEVHELNADEIKFELIDFFDWQLFHWRTFGYYRAKVRRWDAQPQKVGAEVLLDVFSLMSYSTKSNIA